jgi:hypothetical protein
MSPRPDLKYSLDLLKRINLVRVNGAPLSSWKIFNDYNVWHIYQQFIFIEDIKEFSTTKHFIKNRGPSVLIRIRENILRLIGLGVSLMSLIPLIIGRRKVLVYGIDRTNSIYNGDARIDYIYEFLTKHHITYVEAFHTIFNRAFLKNILRRKRLAFYIRAIDTLYSLLHLFATTEKIDINHHDLEHFSAEEQLFIQGLIYKYVSRIPRTVFRIKFLTRIFKLSGIKVILAIDSARDYHEVILAAKFAGIPTYAFQHGHFTKYHVGWLMGASSSSRFIAPDILFVWSDYWKKELLRLGTYFTPDQLVVGGVRRVIDEVRDEKSHHQKLGVLIPYEIEGYKDQIKKYIEKILACRDTVIYFKTRSDIPKDKQFADYHLEPHERLQALPDIEPELHNIDVVAGTYSTFLYDMIQYNKPVAILETDSDYGEGMVTNGLARKITTKENICTVLHELKNMPESIRKELRDKLFGKQLVFISETLSAVTKKHGLL